jgi:hypothetical protein
MPDVKYSNPNVALLAGSSGVASADNVKMIKKSMVCILSVMLTSSA